MMSTLRSKDLKKIYPIKWLRYHYLKLLRIRTNPTFFARGIAIGVFIGLTPTIPFHTILIILLSYLLNGHILAGLLISYLICNPITIPFIYLKSWFLGCITLGRFFDINFSTLYSLFKDVDLNTEKELLIKSFAEIGFDALLVLNFGGLIFATPFALISYKLSFNIYKKWHKKRLKINETE